MGIHDLKAGSDGEQHRAAMRRVLADLEALDRMLTEGLIESDRARIGAEQELILLDQHLDPASIGPELLAQIDDERVTLEIARFNLEFNCHPLDFAGPCFSRLRSQLGELMAVVQRAAGDHGARALITGICPTMQLSNVCRENISPRDRYFALDEVLRAMRGTDYELRVKGADELTVRHPTVMLEAVNTSFQVHYQVAPERFAAAYNVAQATAAAVLAACVNSPVLFGKRLWRETRIAIFQQVVDTRADAPGTRDLLARVRFGEAWVKRSVLEIFRNDIARFRMIIAPDAVEDPMAELDAGRAPKLRALQAFNSTVYRWMRPCYGVTDGRPHLRIENRLLPAGPTLDDEVANAAFWLGLMAGGVEAWPDLTDRLDFEEARSNFITAAREGLACHLTWLDHEELTAGELILEHLLPVARRGLEMMSVDADDIDGTLGIIEQRVTTRQTGASWMLRSVAAMRGKGSRAERLQNLTRALLHNQESGEPVHRWPIAEMQDEADWQAAYARVSQYMTTDLYTVAEDESIDLVASIMDWENLRHVPVEDDKHRLVGLVSYRSLLRRLVKSGQVDMSVPVPVSEVMVSDPVTVSPDTSTLEAIRIMRTHKVACLPVIEDGRLVGIISERDYMDIAGRLLERTLSGHGRPAT